jgi:hypothetical protein
VDIDYHWNLEDQRIKTERNQMVYKIKDIKWFNSIDFIFAYYIHLYFYFSYFILLLKWQSIFSLDDSSSWGKISIPN